MGIKFAFVLLLISINSTLFGQRVFLVKKNDTVFIRKGFVGISTKNEIYKYKELKELSYEIVKFNKDSFLIKRPIKFHDTTVSFENYSVPFIGRDFRFNKSFRENGNLMCKLYIIDQYQYDLFEPSKLLSISYPPKSDHQVGCIFCIFVPIYNLFYLQTSRKYHIPKTYLMSEWKIMFDHG